MNLETALKRCSMCDWCVNFQKLNIYFCAYGGQSVLIDQQGVCPRGRKAVESESEGER